MKPENHVIVSAEELEVSLSSIVQRIKNGETGERMRRDINAITMGLEDLSEEVA